MTKSKPTALITGASSGIGLELARIHAARGGDLVITARRTDRLDALKAELEAAHKVTVTVIAGDLTDPLAPAAIYDAVKAAGIEIDYLINNAGFGGLGRYDQMDWSRHESMIAVNITALAKLTHLFLPDFIARGSGRILNVSSIASLVPGPGQAVYYASKAFVTYFSNAIDQEARQYGVTSTALLPGSTATEFRDVAGLQGNPLFDRTFTAHDVARTGYRGMLKGKLTLLAGLSLGQRIQMALLPFAPMRNKLRLIHGMQLPKEAAKA
ncbi:SDR family NAD(P)-dependent oxidoreductase [Maricaulis maris]|uniref:Ketoreductase domain-containing protein n=1 Tax=Maricaulis maris TaxID=74318 RepID=A0A495DKV6_9PROT|nr:SDR family oxidoreductase [Maricaulis maris]RKR03241.1 hypothetical protein C7435_1196 [Maricaulis maris]